MKDLELPLDMHMHRAFVAGRHWARWQPSSSLMLDNVRAVVQQQSCCFMRTCTIGCGRKPISNEHFAGCQYPADQLWMMLQILKWLQRQGGLGHSGPTVSQLPPPCSASGAQRSLGLPQPCLSVA